MNQLSEHTTLLNHLEQRIQQLEEINSLQNKDIQLKWKELEEANSKMTLLKDDIEKKEQIIQEYRNHQKKVSFVLLRGLYPIVERALSIQRFFRGLGRQSSR